MAILDDKPLGEETTKIRGDRHQKEERARAGMRA